jgi:hypothetical protein
MVQQHLHAHAHAHRLAGGGLEHRFLQTGIAQFAHAVAHRALPGQHHALGSAHFFRPAVTITSSPLSAATCITACDTLRRLPMP